MVYRCFACEEDLDESEFQMVPATNGKKYRRSICRPCAYRRYSKYQKKRIPVEPLRKFMHELVHHCGSERAAARRLGISHSQFRQWRGKRVRYDGHGRRQVQTHITRPCAARILTTLREVRSEHVHR